MKNVVRQRYSLVSILLEQGILFFCSISIFTLSGVILQYRAPARFFQRLPNAFELPLSCTLTARFILHLRKWYAAQLEDSKDCVKSGSIVFQVPIGLPSETALTGMIAMEDFGPDPVVLAAAKDTNQMQIQLTHVLQKVREKEGDDHCAAGQPDLAMGENEMLRQTSHSQVTALDNTVQAFPFSGGTLAEAMTVHTNAVNIISALSTAASDEQAVDTFSETKGQAIEALR
ncbi:hypothetical protein B0H19DRAFT_1264799 [Mycena capillaripes]|nr:hypothetical protein B0H19DRAFT_1264799 [Mycena capillaripes]